MACRKERVNDIKYNIKMAPSLKTGEINLQTVVFFLTQIHSTEMFETSGSIYQILGCKIEHLAIFCLKLTLKIISHNSLQEQSQRIHTKHFWLFLFINKLK